MNSGDTYIGHPSTKEIERLLRRLGARGNLSGFPLAVYMIEQVMVNPDQLSLITKRLYRDTARKFGRTPESAERNLRTLIQVCWNQRDRSLLESIAGRTLYKTPTNSEFLDMVAAFLRK